MRRNMKNYVKVKVDYHKYKESKNGKVIKDLYEEIKNGYLNDKDLNIQLEKIYIKERLEKYQGESFTLLMSIYISVMVTVLTIIIGNNLEQNYSNIQVYTLLIVLPILFILIGKFSSKTFKFEKAEHLYYSISLDVINELEQDK